MPNSFGSMVQAIAALAQIQSTRRAQDLAEQQFETQKSQFAQQLGFNEKSKEYKQIDDLLSRISASSTDSRNALVELGQSMHLDPASVQALAHFGQAAPESLEMLRTGAAGRGYASANPQQQQAMNTEAASTAMAGMNQGQMGMSGLQAQLANRTVAGLDTMFKPDLAPILRAYLTNTAAGKSPADVAISQAIANSPAMVQRAAGAQAGTTLTANQAAQNVIGQGQVQAAQGQVQADFYRTNAQIIANSQELAAKIASAKALGGLTVEQLSSSTGQLRDLITQMGKEKSQANRLYLMGLYNNLAQHVAPQAMIHNPDEAPGAASLLERMTDSFNPPGAVGTPSNPYFTPPLSGQPPAGIPTRPMGYSPQDIQQYLNNLGSRP